MAIFALILILAISGCKGSGSTGKPITNEDVYKGFDGLNIGFTKNAPPDKVFEESIFPIAINLKNKGASDIKDGFLSLGFEEEFINFNEKSSEPIRFEIKGKSTFNPNGDEDFTTANAKTAKRIGSQSETHPSTIFATACYPYKTILGTSVCVDPDIFGTQLRKKSCQSKDLDFANGQGGPVAIIKIETRTFPDQDNERVRPHFILYIENKGSGQVIIPDGNKIRSACTKEKLDFTDFNRIKIKATLSNQELECRLKDEKTSTEVRLRDKKDVVRCTYPESAEGIRRNTDAFTAPLRIEMDYGYTFTISKDIIIEKILKY